MDKLERSKGMARATGVKRKRIVIRQWDKDALLVVVVGLLGALWITGYLGTWVQ